MRERNIYKLLFILPLFGFSCSQEEDMVIGDEIDDAVNFTLDFPTRSVGAETTDESNLDPLYDYFNKNESILLIAQRTQDHSISFEDNNGDGDNQYLFKYVWNGDEANTLESDKTPNWGSGYNFSSLESWENPLTWSTAIKNGAFGSSYAFGALYYPIDNSIRNSIEDNQSELEGLKKSNILGAYHLTESLYERFRFRLYHLMACIRVTIQIPDKRTEEDGGFTGYDDRVFKAYMLNVQKDFVIDWGAGSSEEPPILRADDSSETRPTKINMFETPVTNHEPVEIDLSNYGLEGTDYVRQHTFTVLFPPQTLSNTKDILQFDMMRANGRQVDIQFTWSTSQLITNLQVSPGTITNLVLYFTREENEALLVRSEITDWTHTDTTVTVTPENSAN